LPCMSRNAKGPRADALGPLQIPGDNRLSGLRHYHGPRRLNGRVRDGNGCGPPGLVTGKLPEYQQVAVRVALCLSLGTGATGSIPGPSAERSKAAKRSAVSTGQLRPLRAVHTRPIDLVVFQEPVLHEAAGGLVLRRVSRLDAFSVYPGRTLATQRCA
jgi:hypothetical protein